MTWKAEDELRLTELLRYEDQLPRLEDYIVRVNPRLPPPPHLMPLIDVWERTRYERVLAVVEMPPRHAKTTTCCHGLAWRIEGDPALRHAYCTYGDALALEKSRTVRRLVTGSGIKLAGDQANLHHWKTEEDGGLVATGVGGPLTGKGIDGVAVVDDSIKNRKEAESRLVRDGVWDWFTDVVWTRLEDDASVIVPQTRWHKDDLVGRLLEGFEDPGTGAVVQFERIKLPAVCDDEDDLIGREFGEALWPERFPLEKLAGIRAILGDYSWYSLYQQDPRVKGDRLFRVEPSRFRLDNWELDGHRVIIVCDPAATAKTTADYSVILVMAAKGFGPNMEAWVIDHFRAQVEVPVTCAKLKAFQSAYWGVAIGVEAVGGFKAIPQMLKAEDSSLRLLEIHPLGDKFTRAQPVASAYNAGRLHVPIDRPWAKTLLKEAEDFTGVNDKTDDQIDTLAHGWNTLYAAKEPRRRGPRIASHLPFG